MVFKNFVCAVSTILLAAGLSFAPQSASAQTWTVTTTGQISTGYDTSGIFGTANADLTGMTYTQTITASIDPSQWSAAILSSFDSYLYGAGPSFTDTVTVGGHSFTVTATTFSGGQYLQDARSTENASQYDTIYTYDQGITTSGNSLYVRQYAASSSTPFVPVLSFNQAISQDVSSDAFGKAAYFGLFGNEEAYFSGVPNSIAVNVDAVPEPGTLLMMLAGIGMLGCMSRRSVEKANCSKFHFQPSVERRCQA